MTYYSQSSEDEFLNTYYFKNKKNGLYLELGALDGVLYSNTKYFEDSHNWKGILIEPHPVKFELLKKNRPNNFLFNSLVSDKHEMLEFLYFTEYLTQVSGVVNSLSQHHYDAYFNNNKFSHIPQEKILLQPKTLSEIINSTGIKHIDLLSLDVEGHEYEVLMSFNFDIEIDVILIETLGVEPTKDDQCRQLLIKNGFLFSEKCKHNEVFVSPSFKASMR
jgi:FkbM family methyltransferase